MTWRSVSRESLMIGRLNHVAIAVRDLEKACAVYRDTLGARVSPAVQQPEHGVTTVFVELPNTKIELLEPLGPIRPSPASSSAMPTAVSTTSATRWTTSLPRATIWWRRGLACWAAANRRSVRTASPCSSSTPRISAGRSWSWSRPDRPLPTVCSE
jgi:Lactoylglutathione lyase and related lyases